MTANADGCDRTSARFGLVLMVACLAALQFIPTNWFTKPGSSVPRTIPGSSSFQLAPQSNPAPPETLRVTAIPKGLDSATPADTVRTVLTLPTPTHRQTLTSPASSVLTPIPVGRSEEADPPSVPQSESVSQIRKCLAGQKILFVGHSHVVHLARGLCRLGEFQGGCGKISFVKWDDRRPIPGIQPWGTDDIKNVPESRPGAGDRVSLRIAMDPYITGDSRTSGRKKGIPKSAAKWFKYDIIVTGTGLWDLYYRNTSPFDLYKWVSKQLELIRTWLKPNQTGVMLVYLIHYNRVPTWPSRAPCAEERRILGFNAAIERAAIEVSQKFPSNHRLLFLDLYEEIKNLPEKNVWPDGHHVDEEVLSSAITEVLRSKLWHPDRPSCRTIPHRIEHFGMTKRNVLRGVDTSRLATLTAGSDAGLDWPSRPSCQIHDTASKAFFHTSAFKDPLRPGWHFNWARFQPSLAEFYVKEKYPQDPMIRLQLVESVCTSGPSDEQACSTNIGLSENATDWSEPARDSQRLLELMRRARGNPPPCLCKNATSLVDDLQLFLEANAKEELSAWKPQIERSCTGVLSRLKSFVTSTVAVSPCRGLATLISAFAAPLLRGAPSDATPAQGA
jgi:hypothetical protein